jgi:hypothetical protein
MIRSKKIRFELSAEEFLFIMCWKILLLQFDQNWELEEVIKHHFYVKIKKIFYHPLLLILTSLVSSNKISKINFWDK